MHYGEPTEPVWSNLKRSLANLVKQDIGQLTALVKTRLRRMQYQPGLLEGFLAKPRLDLTRLQQLPQLKIVRPQVLDVSAETLRNCVWVFSGRPSR